MSCTREDVAPTLATGNRPGARRCARQLAYPETPLQSLAERTLTAADLPRRKTGELRPGTIGVGPILHELGGEDEASEGGSPQAAERRRKRGERGEHLPLGGDLVQRRMRRQLCVEAAHKDSVAHSYRLQVRANGLVGGVGGSHVRRRVGRVTFFGEALDDPGFRRRFRAALDRKSTRLNSSHSGESRMPSSA